MIARRVFVTTIGFMLMSIATIQAQQRTTLGAARSAAVDALALRAAFLGASSVPPPSEAGHLGLSPDATYVYRFVDTPDVTNGVWSSDEKQAVEDAFRKWQSADGKSGLNTTFTAWAGGEGISGYILLRKRPLPKFRDRLVPAKTLATTGPDGTVIGGVVDFNTNTEIISNKNGFLKAALHEIGHLHGLGHPRNTGLHVSSVMNDFGEISGGKLYEKRDDFTHNMPDDVTKRDRENAFLFAGSRQAVPADAMPSAPELPSAHR